MKLLLISHQNTTWDITDLPLLQWYEVESEARYIDQYDKNKIKKIYYTIKTTYGSIYWIEKENFLTQEECREQNLNNLLDT